MSRLIVWLTRRGPSTDMAQQELRLSSRLDIFIVVAVGAAVVLHSLRELSRAPLDPRWLMLAALNPSQRLIHRQGPRNSRKTFCIRDFCIRGSPAVWRSGSHHDSCARHSSHILLARAKILPTSVTRCFQRSRCGYRDLGIVERFLHA